MRSRLFIALLGLAACESRTPSLEEAPPPDPQAAAEAAPVEFAATPPREAPPKVAPTDVRTPEWPAERDEFARSRLTDAARVEVDRSPLPALVVAETKLLASTVVTTGPHWYSATSRDGGLTTTLHGTRLAHQHAHIPPASGRSAVRGRPAFVTENEGIVSAAWVEGGVAYALDVECRDRDDARCHGEGFVVGLASRLVFVGGHGGAR